MTREREFLFSFLNFFSPFYSSMVFFVLENLFVFIRSHLLVLRLWGCQSSKVKAGRKGRPGDWTGEAVGREKDWVEEAGATEKNWMEEAGGTEIEGKGGGAKQLDERGGVHGKGLDGSAEGLEKKWMSKAKDTVTIGWEGPRKKIGWEYRGMEKD